MKIFVRSIVVWVSFLLAQSILAKDSIKMQREGFVFGIATGSGYINTSIPNDKNNSQWGNIAYNWKFGYMLNSITAILLQGNVSTYRYEGNSDSTRERLRGFEGIIPSIQYFVSNRIWLSGGLGLGMDNPVFYDVKNENEGKYYAGGFKTTLGIGYEIWHKINKALDIQTRLSYGNAKVPEGKRKSVAVDILIGYSMY